MCIFFLILRLPFLLTHLRKSPPPFGLGRTCASRVTFLNPRNAASWFPPEAWTPPVSTCLWSHPELVFMFCPELLGSLWLGCWNPVPPLHSLGPRRGGSPESQGSVTCRAVTASLWGAGFGNKRQTTEGNLIDRFCFYCTMSSFLFV